VAIDKQLSSFMPHTVTIAPFSTKNAYGEDSFSATTRSASAYVEPNTQFSYGDQTVEKTTSKIAYISDTSITINDKITLPDSSTPEIVSIVIHDEVVGLEHTMVTFL
jgi:hypothetical protein